jgi:hypothetical protein
MSNLSDKDIDRLSREAADSYEPDASSLNWNRLEQKLVEQMPEHPPDGFHFGRISPYVWGPAVVLIAGISFYIIKASIYSKLFTRTSEPVSQISKAKENSLSAKVNSKPTVRSSVATSQSGANRDELKSASSLSNTQQSDVQIATSVPAADGVSKIAIPSAALKGETGAAHGVSSGTIVSATGLTTAHGTETAAGGGSSPNDLSSANQSVSSTNSANVHSIHKTQGYELPLLITVGSGPGTVKGNDSLLNKHAAPGTPVAQKSVQINRSLNIGFTFGADYTDAGGITNNQLSNNIGITLGYYLTNKLSVNTGLIYSNKFYWAPGKGQNRPNNSSSMNRPWAPDIEYINGSCNMYELPLTIRYDFAKNDKTLFFVNAGASSYFLLKQTNIYFTHNGGGRPVAWLSKDESQSNYWFGVGDISVGLETDLGKGFSFQAEPFFRIPFQNMGVENLKMYSYGFMLSFRYAPVLSRTKK